LELVHDDDNRIAARDAVAEAIMTSFNDARIDMSTPELSIGTIDQRPDHKPSKSA